MTPDELIRGLQAAFDYTSDNNRDLVGDPTFSMAELAEELEVERSYQFPIGYIHRNEDMIKSQLEADA